MILRNPRPVSSLAGWLVASPANLLVLALAVLGAAWMVAQLRTPDAPVMSRWQSAAPASVGQVALRGAAQPLAQGEHSVVMPLPAEGPFRQNVLAALTANNGALTHVVLPPGGRWSFNRAIGDPALLRLATINGIYGGGWCDLASRYVMALRPLLPPEALAFPRHRAVAGIGLSGVADDDAVAIWNTNNQGSEQDLVITNTAARPLSIAAQLVDGGVEVRARLQ